MQPLKPLKDFLGAVSLLFLLAVGSTSVCTGQVGPTTITLSTNRVAAALTNSTAGTATGHFANETLVNILMTTYSTNATIGDGDVADGTFTLRFYGSFDGSTYFQNGTNWDVVVDITATNAVNTWKALDTSSIQYLRPELMMNSCTGAVIFPTAVYFYK